MTVAKKAPKKAVKKSTKSVKKSVKTHPNKSKSAKYFSTATLAEHCHCTEKTIYNWIRDGKIKFTRCGPNPTDGFAPGEYMIEKSSFVRPQGWNKA
jgi:excisionase family DNA binding protein